MPRTLTAMFDSRPDAEHARRRLCEAGIDERDVRLIDQASGAASSGRETRGLWEQFKELFVSDNDAHGYAEGVRRGGTMLTARVDDGLADRAAHILDDAGSVDLDAREASWRGEGWTGGPPPAAAGTAPVPREGDMARSGARVRSYQADAPRPDDLPRAAERPAPGAGNAGPAAASSAVQPSATAGGGVADPAAWVREELLVRRAPDGRIVAIDDPVRRAVVHIDDRDGEARRAAA